MLNEKLFTRISGALGVLVWLGLAVYLAMTLWLGFAGAVYPFQLDYGEGIVLEFTRKLALGQAIYKPLNVFPYASSNYPPVAMLLAALFRPLVGDTYIAGRLLNFATALMVGALVFAFVRARRRGEAFAGLWANASPLLAALFFLGAPYVYHWVALFRADLIGLAFTVAGVYCVWQWEVAHTRNPFSPRKRVSGDLLLAACFFLLALYTKQSFFIAPVAAALAIFLRARRMAVMFVLGLGLTGGALYLALDYWTAGGFSAGLIASNATVWLWGVFAPQARDFVTTFGVLLVLAAFGWMTRVCAGKIGVLEIYALLSAGSIVLAGRIGAWENYFFEVLAMTCVFAGMAISDCGLPLRVAEWQIRNSKFKIQNRATWGAVLGVGLPLLFLVQLGLMYHDPRAAVELMANDYPANVALQTRLVKTSDPIISEDMGALVTSGHPVAYYTFQYSSLARSGKWDQRWELENLSRGGFPLVVLERGTREDVEHFRRFTREFLSELDHYYTLSERLGKFELYTYAPLQNARGADFDGQIEMVGWTLAPDDPRLRAGELNLTVVWQAARAISRSYKVFVHLENADGGVVAQDDREPHAGLYPTSRWWAGEMVREHYTLEVPPNLPRGKYFLRVGWYDAESGDRLSASDGGDFVTLQEFAVE